MILLKLLPGVLKELTRHVPTVFFQVINWGDITSEIPKVSKRILQKDGFLPFLEEQKKFLAPLNLTIEPSGSGDKDQDLSRNDGIRILEIYFAQVFSPHGLFLDLRPQNFKFNENSFTWYPTGAWTLFAPKFREGLLKVYEGFYLGKTEVYREGLVDVGLMDEAWPEEDKQKLSELFQEQFGDADTNEVAFTLDHFNDSMTRMFNFILLKKRSIGVDFLYLGIYLVTLYSSLEKVNSPLPVKDVYLRMREKFAQ